MAKDSKSQIFFVKLGAVKFAFRADPDAYKGIQAQLGVLRAKDTDDNMVFGCNRPRPPKVRLNLANGKSLIRYCDPQKIESIILKGTLNGKKANGQNITSVTLISG